MSSLLMVVLLAAQASIDPLLARLEGRWTGEGTVLGQASALQMEWTWVLDGRFLSLAFRNDMAGTTPRRFEGRAYYRAVAADRYRGFWVDNSGAMRPIEARRDGDALVSTWGTEDTEVGETTYRLAGEGRLEVTDRVRQKDGTWRTFGQSVLMKR